jgi:hypothetical protein
MKMHKKLTRAFAFALLTALSPFAAYADGPITAAAETLDAKFQADRAIILAMAGNYKVKFDFQETTAWQADYTPIAAKISGGHEVVRVIEDTGRVIKLQHLLIAEHDGKTFVIKHWRQDWTYEPASVLVYAGTGTWTLEDVPERMRKGRWSQTVWQTDDSPRYGGWGEWSEEAGVPRWRSNWTWRPLARRDAVRKPVYDRYRAINRHSPSPAGWIHWQDNIKMGMKDGKLTPFVQESVLNSYTLSTSYDPKPADDYWAKTSAYWAAVRAEWDKVIAAQNGVSVGEVAETGSTAAERLMGMASEIKDGTLKTDAAIKQARAVIAEVTAPTK